MNSAPANAPVLAGQIPAGSAIQGTPMLTFAQQVNDADHDKPRSQVPAGSRRLACQRPQGRSDPACTWIPGTTCGPGSDPGMEEEG
jgi:hypothetical protein